MIALTSILSLGFLTSFLFFLWLGSLILFKDPKSSLNRVCALILFSFAIWNFGNVLVSIYLKRHTLFDTIDAIGWCSFPVFALWFFLIFTKKKRILKHRIIYLLFFLLPLFFIYLQWKGFLIFDMVITPYGYSDLWSKSIWPYLYYAYYLSFILAGYYLCFNFMRKTENIFEKKQAGIILTTGIITLILCTITDVVLPQLKFYIPALASVLVIIWAVGLVYAITRYGLMTITPAVAAEAIIAALTDSLILANPEGKIIFVNRATSDLMGYKKEELIGKSINFLVGGSPSFFEELLKEEITKKKYETNYFDKSGERILVNVNSTLIRDKIGRLAGVVVISHDIRETKNLIAQLSEKIKALEFTRQETEKARLATLNILEDVEEARVDAEEEKSKTQAIITNFVDGLLVFSKDNVLIIVNPQTENIFKIETKLLVGKSIIELMEFPSLRPLINLLVESPAGTEKIRDISRKELELNRNLILEVSTFPILREGEEIGISVILHDVSREKLIEQMKTEFVSLSAHQLRTPLSAIKWTLRMILDGDLGDITKEQRDFLNKTYQSNERMISLINDLLNVARIEEGRYLYKQSSIQIEELIQAVVSSYKDEAERKKINLKFQRPKEYFSRVNLDEEKLGLAIQNLIDNAIRYTQPGGQVTVSLRRANMEIEILVKDSGVGIPEDQQERVFGKFFRGTNAIRLETEGSGLGLFIAKNIVEAHGGKIWFESEENKGTTFHLILPIPTT